MHWLKRIPFVVYGAIVLYALFSFALIQSMNGFVNSPDEAANRFFISRWASEFSLSAPVGIEQPKEYPLFPRSTVPTDGTITPAGFVGVPIIFGFVQKIFGEWVVNFITPLIVIAAAISWWYLMKKIFSDQIAKVSVVLFLFHPAILYYSVRGLFPNVAMIGLSIIAVALAWFAYERASKISWALAGVSAFGALLIRPLETFVLFFAVLLSASIWGDKRLKKIAIQGIGALIGAGLIGFVARNFFELPGGYSFVSFNSFSSIFFPFGIHLGRIWDTCVSFIVVQFFPWVLLGTVGLVWWLIDAYTTKKYRTEIAAYLTVVVPVSFWLFALYGSWSFSDNPQNPDAVTLASSYVRYWLPHLLFRMPFAAVLLYMCAQKFSWNVRRATAIFITASILLGASHALFSDEGLLWLRTEAKNSLETKELVLKKVPENAVIATRAWDKIFFPERLVIQPFPRDPRIFGALRELHARGVPLFAFISTLTEADTLWLRDNKITVEPIEIYGVHTLYKFVWKNE